MSNWSLLGDGQKYETAGVTTASTAGTTITCGSANVKGSYAQLSASVGIPATEMLVQFSDFSAVAASYLLDIAIGAAASEVVLIPNVHLRSPMNATVGGAMYRFLIQVPSGVRLAARCQSTTGSATMGVMASLMAPGLSRGPGLSRVTTYGANTADSGGTECDPGTTAHTAVIVEITSACTNPIRELLVSCPTLNGSTSARYQVRVMVGGGGSEVAVTPYIGWSTHTTPRAQGQQVFGPFPVTIPAGTRLSVEIRSSITDATARDVDVVLYGVD